ncbi:MAG: FAD-dependent oxidoreductase [Aphanocapsa sp. GSE-SYN-MK-11-07L]|jgi:phytoene dehydrogenase-like protein|nr:FAD-dependent oxidoreductase [Aphanocapsa sp. GSE-SYN-MK-11-07L]
MIHLTSTTVPNLNRHALKNRGKPPSGVRSNQGNHSTPNRAAPLKVGIIGAGLAGLTCGYHLAQHNIEFQLFEASDRVGGRIMTYQHSSGETAELGAGYFHNHYHALLNLIDQLGLSAQIVQRQGSQRVAFCREGAAVSLSKNSSARSVFDRLQQAILSDCQKGNQLLQKYEQNDRSFMDTVDEDPYWRHAISTPFTESDLYRGLDAATQAYLIRPFTRKQLASDPENLSLMTAIGALGATMLPLKTLRGGLITLPNALYAAIELFVRLATPVTQVARSGQQWILTLNNDQVYKCDVLVTSSLTGSLRDFCRFKPDLAYGQTHVLIVEGELKSAYKSIDSLFSQHQGHGIDGITRYGDRLFKVNSCGQSPDLNFFFQSFDILSRQLWKSAIPQMPANRIYPAEELSENLHLIGDHWLPCMEMAVLTGRKAAQKILAVS